LLPINTSFTQAPLPIQLDTGSDEEHNMTDAENDIFGDALRRITTSQQALPVVRPEFHHQVIKPVFWHPPILLIKQPLHLRLAPYQIMSALQRQPLNLRRAPY
jgi:hypothetical protein